MSSKKKKRAAKKKSKAAATIAAATEAASPPQPPASTANTDAPEVKEEANTNWQWGTMSDRMSVEDTVLKVEKAGHCLATGDTIVGGRDGLMQAYFEVELTANAGRDGVPGEDQAGFDIGLVRPSVQDHDQLYISTNQAYYLYTKTCTLFGNGKGQHLSDDFKGRELNEGDRVGVFVNLEVGIIKFYANGQELGKGFEGVWRWNRDGLPTLQEVDRMTVQQLREELKEYRFNGEQPITSGSQTALQDRLKTIVRRVESQTPDAVRRFRVSGPLKFGVECFVRGQKVTIIPNAPAPAAAVEYARQLAEQQEEEKKKQGKDRSAAEEGAVPKPSVGDFGEDTAIPCMNGRMQVLLTDCHAQHVGNTDKHLQIATELVWQPELKNSRLLYKQLPGDRGKIHILKKAGDHLNLGHKFSFRASDYWIHCRTTERWASSHVSLADVPESKSKVWVQVGRVDEEGIAFQVLFKRSDLGSHSGPMWTITRMMCTVYPGTSPFKTMGHATVPTKPDATVPTKPAAIASRPSP